MGHLPVSEDCPECQGNGWHPRVGVLELNFYEGWRGSRRVEEEGWRYQLTDDEVEALARAGRLWGKSASMTKAKDVNKLRGTMNRMGIDDAVGRHVLVKARAKRYGIWGPCPTCDGTGLADPSIYERLAAVADFDD